MNTNPMKRHDAVGRRGARAGWAAVLGALVMLAGCGRPAGVVFDPANAEWRWPAPPEPARVRYVGELKSSADLKPGRDFFEVVGEVVFGKESEQTFLSPFAVCTGGDRLFVADSNAQLVHMFDLKSRAYARWRPPEGSPSFAQPVGIAYDPSGRVLVSDSVAGVLVVFDADGEYMGTLGEGSLSRPTGLAVEAATGRIFVADAGAHQIVVLSREGELIERLGGRGTEPGRFNFPTDVVFDSDGRLYVCDSLNFRVQVFDAALKAVGQIGSKGDLPGYFSQPKGVAVDPENHVYVVDAHFENVQIFDGEGALLMAFGREGRGPGEFWLPAGIHIDQKGRIWIADVYNRRVQVFDYVPEEAGP